MEMDDNFYTYFDVNNPRKTVDWMRENGLLQTAINCDGCNEMRKLKECSKSASLDQYKLFCKNDKCLRRNTCVTVRTGSIFYHIKYDLYTLLHLIYLWSKENDFIVVGKKLGVPSPTVATFYIKLRKICIEYFNHNPVTLGTLDRNAIVVRQVFQVGNNLILELIDVGASPVVGFLEKVDSNEQTKIDSITEKVVSLGCIVSPEDTVAYEQVVFKYRRKYFDLIISDTNEMVNSLLKRAMWMDRFGHRPCYYLCQHIKAYGNLVI